MSRPFLPAIGRAGYDTGDPDVLLRTQVLVLHTILTALLSLTYTYSHWQSGAHGLALFFALFAAAVVALLGALRATGSVRWAAHGTVFVGITCTAAATYFTGGLRLTNVCPFFIVIVSAIFLLGWEGMGWALLAVLAPLGFDLATRYGYSFPDHVPPESRDTDALITWLVGIVVTWAFVICYEAARVYSNRRRAEAEAVRSQFLANVSHELRTPLHAIMGMTRSALRNDLPPSVRAGLETSQHSAEALLALIEDLLDLASLERDRFVLRARDFDPVELVQRVASVLRFRCEEQDLECVVTVDPDVPRWVRGDGNRLQQVLLNLGSNAVKYTEQGQVELSASLVSQDGDTRSCRFSVTDTGLGISEADQQRIFGQFTQVDGTLTRTHEGAGLGLYIASEIVTAMGGRIELESEVGRGSTFQVTLPFEPAESAAPEPVEPQPHATKAGQSPRLLLVDDDRVNVEMARVLLEELCDRVWVARNGQQAIDTWAAEQPDVILMDIQMPGMDGLEAIARIREREQDEDKEPVPIIAVTGYGTEDQRERCREAGADDCLFKPYRFEELEAAIAAVVTGPNRPKGPTTGR
ncbi:MAG: response regulator [Deltaproteobacteria bacterium]|nr:response regulator [Deltaproteobacteria bacterium]